LPLWGNLTLLFVCPWTDKVSIGVRTTMRKAEPEITWQSVQWQSITRAGSMSAVKDTAPQ
jgi:hypothetical protein